MTDELLRLITAALDGELPPAEARRLRQVLATSPEMRAWYDRLRSDAARLRSLPRVAPPADLTTRILARLAEVPARRPVEPAPVVTRHRPLGPARRRSGLPVAVAALVFVSVTAGSFLLFLEQLSPTPGRGTARLQPAPTGPVSADDAASRDDASSVENPRPRPSASSTPTHPPAVRTATTTDPPAPPPPSELALAPEPRPARVPLVGSSFIPQTQFDRIDVRVPFLRSVVELEQDEVRRQLTAELTGDLAYRVDLFVRNPVRAVELFRDAARADGLTLLADATTSGLLQKRQVTAVVVYCESLTPEEVARLLARVTAEDAKVSPRVFGTIHVVPAGPADAQDLKALLGTDPGLFKRAASEPPAGTDPNGLAPRDPSRPLSAGTADHIIKSVTAGPSGTPTPTGEKTALLLTWQPLAARTPPSQSAEIKQFLAKRSERRPRVVPVLFILRPGY